MTNQPPQTVIAGAVGWGGMGRGWLLGIFESKATDFFWLQTLHLFLKCTLNYYAQGKGFYTKLLWEQTE